MGPIGVFDSGYGGLTVLRQLVQALPDVDFIYLGDNARSPYGSRSFETIHRYTLQAVQKLFEMGAPLVILACNTASARALRTIQQRDLPRIAPDKRVLGVIRPAAEEAHRWSKTGELGLLATEGTVRSDSYRLELANLHPHMKLYQQACPLWAPFVENGEIDGAGVEWFLRRDLDRLFSQGGQIDSLLLGCTHYPLLRPVIERLIPPGVAVVEQGAIVAEKLVDYLNRHPEISRRISRGASRRFFTSESPSLFEERSSLFYGSPISADAIHWG